MFMKTIHHTSEASAAEKLRSKKTNAGTALIEPRVSFGVSRLALAAALLCLFWSARHGQAQTPCPGSESCTGLVAELICPTPGTTLPGNDVTFTWCNANADYFLQMES